MYIAFYKLSNFLSLQDGWKSMVGIAWDISPALAVQLSSRFTLLALQGHLQNLIADNPMDVVTIPEALKFMLTDRILRSNNSGLKVSS